MASATWVFRFASRFHSVSIVQPETRELIQLNDLFSLAGNALGRSFPLGLVPLRTCCQTASIDGSMVLRPLKSPGLGPWRPL